MTEFSSSYLDLERSLQAVGRAIDYPEARDLAPQVRRRIQGLPSPVRHERFGDRFRRPLAAAVAAVVLLSAFMLASEPAREAVADWLGVDDVRITFEPPPGPVADTLGLGEGMSLAAAERRVSFEILVPAALGEPDEVYLEGDVSSGMVSLAYATGPDLPDAGGRDAGLIVNQFEASLGDSEIFTKFARFETIVSEVRVRGVTGYWISTPHDLYFNDDSGEEQFERSRLAGPALVWQEGEVVFRIESGLPQARVLDIAESLR